MARSHVQSWEELPNAMQRAVCEDVLQEFPRLLDYAHFESAAAVEAVVLLQTSKCISTVMCSCVCLPLSNVFFNMPVFRNKREARE